MRKVVQPVYNKMQLCSIPSKLTSNRRRAEMVRLFQPGPPKKELRTTASAVPRSTRGRSVVCFLNTRGRAPSAALTASVPLPRAPSKLTKATSLRQPPSRISARVLTKDINYYTLTSFYTLDNSNYLYKHDVTFDAGVNSAAVPL